MDRPIDPDFRRRQILRRSLIIGGCLLLGVSLLLWGPSWIEASVRRSRLRTAHVDAGPLEATISSSGTVVPEFEGVLSSPISARVIEILKRPGTLVAKGEPILVLDVSENVLGVEKVQQSLALKQNQQAKSKLDLNDKLISLQSQWDIKSLELQSYKAEAAQNRELQAQGLISRETLRRSELQVARANTELKRIEDEKANAQQSTQTQLEGLALEMRTLEKERTEAERQLNLATTKSDRNGVLTWVVAAEGATVNKGEVIAKIADLKSFRVQATVSDVHANRVTTGLPAKVKVGEQYLSGRVSEILPTIQNGIITLTVELEERSSSLLRSNLRVDVLIITARKDRVLRIRKGPALVGEGTQDVFVVRGSSAVRTSVRLGAASFDHHEVVQGLLEGDEVIVSDMADYIHLKEVAIK